MKEYLALFDLDGTLYDTSKVNWLSYQEALKPYGFSLDENYFAKNCNGRHYSEFLPEIMGNSEYIDDVHIAKKNFYKTNLLAARENFHLFNIIESIKDRYYIGIVTTASRKNTMDILKYFGRIDLFDDIVAQEDITKVKPDPEGFIIGMKKFNISKDNTVIFEDSEIGIKAAKASGASVITVSYF